jgi:hypothetical protein
MLDRLYGDLMCYNVHETRIVLMYDICNENASQGLLSVEYNIAM